MLITDSLKQKIIYVYQYLIYIGLPLEDINNILKQVLFILSQTESIPSANNNFHDGSSNLTSDTTNLQMKLLQFSIHFSLNTSRNHIHKHLIGLRYYLNMDYQEISQLLGIDVNRMAFMMYEARKLILTGRE